MLTHHLRRIAFQALLVTATVPLMACYDDEMPPPAYAYGYEPQYYNGAVVYYDGVGRPFYYERGGPVWVSPGSPYYGGLTAHWRLHGAAYGQWYAHYGTQHRGYRAGGGGGRGGGRRR
jgi:hypothetical protein